MNLSYINERGSFLKNIQEKGLSYFERRINCTNFVFRSYGRILAFHMSIKQQS